MPLYFGGQGVTPSLEGLPSSAISLAAGECWLVPAGWFECKPGPFTVIQNYDPITGIWRTIGGGQLSIGSLERIRSDGVNYRLANQSGCAVGAVVTTAGSGYTTAPTVTASSGTSIWRAIIGGAVATSVTVTAGGSGYTYPPIVVFSVPPNGGVQATGTCTLSSGAVNAVAVTNQGAGYNSAPTVSFINDPREGLNGTTTGANAAAIATLTGAGTITAVVCVDHGNAVTGTVVPTLAFSTGAAAATIVMCWSITAYVVSATTAGSGYTTPVIISAYETPISGSVLTNPLIQNALVKKRNAFIVGALSTGAFTATGQTVVDGGVYDVVPTVYVQSSNVFGAGAVAGVFLAPTMGGVSDSSLIFPG